MSELKRCQVYLTVEQYEHLRRKSYELHETISSILRGFINFDIEMIKKYQELELEEKEQEKVKNDQLKERKLEIIHEVIEELFGEED